MQRLGKALADAGFGHKIQDTVFESPQRLVGVGGDNDGVERAGHKVFQQIHPVVTAKVEVEQQDVHRRLGEPGTCGFEGPGDAQPLQRFAENRPAKSLEAPGDQGLVFRDQDFHGKVPPNPG